MTPTVEISSAPDLSPFDVTLNEDGTLAIPYQPSKAQVAEILDRISASGIDVKDLTTEEADLEDVFLELTYNA